MSKLANDKNVVQVRPDSKGRVTLGKLANGVSSFIISKQPGGSLLLGPMVEIPAREKWLFKNQTALESVKRGLDQTAKGEILSLGSFAEFVNEDEEE